MLQSFKNPSITHGIILVKPVLDGCMLLIRTHDGVKITYIYGQDAKKLLEEQNGYTRKV